MLNVIGAILIVMGTLGVLYNARLLWSFRKLRNPHRDPQEEESSFIESVWEHHLSMLAVGATLLAVGIFIVW